MKKPFIIKRQIRPEEEILKFTEFLYRRLKTSHKEISTPNRMKAIAQKRRVIGVLLASPDYFNLGAIKTSSILNINHNTIYHYYNLIGNFVNCQEVIDELWNIWKRGEGERSVFLSGEPEFKCESIMKKKNFHY